MCVCENARRNLSYNNNCVYRKKYRIEESPPPRHVVTFETPYARNNNPCKYQVVTVMYARTYVDMSTYLPHRPFTAGRFVENTASRKRLVSVSSRAAVTNFRIRFPTIYRKTPKSYKSWTGARVEITWNHKTHLASKDRRKSKKQIDDDEACRETSLDIGKRMWHRTINENRKQRSPIFYNP